jgi:hypothetical protein
VESFIGSLQLGLLDQVLVYSYLFWLELSRQGVVFEVGYNLRFGCSKQGGALIASLSLVDLFTSDATTRSVNKTEQRNTNERYWEEELRCSFLGDQLL